MAIVQQEIKYGLQSFKIETNKLIGIELIEKELYSALADSEGAIRDMCNHILKAGGKRIRPLLVLYSGLIFNNDSSKLIKAAVAAELIHMASLVHDDIIDESNLRRSKPSINKLWGNHFAVLCGDYLFAKAFGILADNRLVKNMDYMVQAIQNMCHGEIAQAGGRFDYNVDIDTYYKRIAQKTAIFIQCCCKSGACAGGADEAHVQSIGDYGLNLGLAFQIIDDILDFCGDVNIMGKPRGEDLRQGSITLPVILLMKDTKYGDWLKKILIKSNITEQDIDNITDILRQSGVIKRSFDIAVSHIEKAKDCLELMPGSQYTDQLYKLADMLKARTN